MKQASFYTQGRKHHSDYFTDNHNYLYIQLGDNNLGRYIVGFGYMIGNLVLRRRASGAVKHDFQTYIRRYASPTENFEYGYPNSNALLQFHY